MTKNFSATVGEFASRSVEDMRNVMRESVQDVLQTAQLPKPLGGRMPVMDGFLINSLTSGLNGEFKPASDKEDLSGAASIANYTATIDGMDIGDIAQFAWTAAYARRMEYGFSGTDKLDRTYNQTGNFFIGTSVAQWETFVAAQVARLK